MLFSIFLKFASAGVVGTACHYLVLTCAVQLFGINAVISSALGATTGALINYVLTYKYVFSSNKKHRETLLKFSIIAVGGLAINTGLMYFFISTFNLNYLVSQLLTSAALLIYSFNANLLWTFKSEA